MKDQEAETRGASYIFLLTLLHDSDDSAVTPFPITVLLSV